MRIDDEDYEDVFLESSQNSINNTLNDIDNLITEISITKSSLRQRKNVKVKNIDLDDIDYVPIKIYYQNEYYNNSERRIIKYNFENLIIYIIQVILFILFNIVSLIKINKNINTK